MRIQPAIDQHLPLVRSVARRYARSGAPMEEIVQAGTIGLIKAIDRFEPDRGLTFSALAAPAIDGEIRHHLRDRAGTGPLPRPLLDLDAAPEYSEPTMPAASQPHGGWRLVQVPQSLHSELAQTAHRRHVTLDALVADMLASALGRPDPHARWTSVALVANFVIVGLAAAVAVVLLIVAGSHGI
jgi:RNA polymerase sigma factor (sigma-70 family)